MKKTLASILAVALALGMSTVALAADYGSGTSKPSNSTATSGSSTGTSSNMPAGSVTGGFVADVAKNATVYITADATIDSEAIQNIKDGGKNVTFKSEEFSVTIAAGSIKDAQDLSLGMSFGIGNGLVEITPKMHGDFGLTMTVSVSLDELQGMKNPRLYYIDDNGDAFDYGAVALKGNTATFKISHASSYVITDGGMAGAQKTSNANTTTGNALTNPDTGAANVAPIVVALLAVGAAGLFVSKKAK